MTRLLAPQEHTVQKLVNLLLYYNEIILWSSMEKEKDIWSDGVVMASSSRGKQGHGKNPLGEMPYIFSFSVVH